MPNHDFFTGKKVGVLQGRLHDIAVVAQHGGILHPGNIRHTMRGIHQLLIMLENKSISGFLIDRNTYYHFSHRYDVVPVSSPFAISKVIHFIYPLKFSKIQLLVEYITILTALGFLQLARVLY